MPRYELMYILSAAAADDQVEPIASAVSKIIADLGGSDIEVEQLGKKKLAYPVKKTRNGFYTLVSFNLEPKRVSDLDAKIRMQTATIIRYLIVNLEEHLKRAAKDHEVQAQLAVAQSRRRVEEPVAETAARAPRPTVEVSPEELDKKIEEALTDEDILK